MFAQSEKRRGRGPRRPWALLLLAGPALLLGACQSRGVSPTAAAGEPGPAYPGEEGAARFTYYGTNPTVEARFDATSTFAIDVDDGSYAIARANLERGCLPDRDGIRVEEFVNHFDYDYPSPTCAPVALIADGSPTPFTPGSHVLRFAIQGGAGRPCAAGPRHLTFLIDTSASMEREDRLSLVRYCVLHLVERLERSDRVTIVSFDDGARTVLAQARAWDRRRIWDAVHGLVASGGSDIERGLSLAYREADTGDRCSRANRRIVLCSDGVASQGSTCRRDLVDLVSGHRRRGVPLSVVGVGLTHYDDAVLEQIANAGDGTYTFVDSQDDIRRAFGFRFLASSSIVAKDVKVQVEFDPSTVETWRLLGYENRHVEDQAFRDPWTDGGELGSGQSTTALYEVQLHAGRCGRVASFRVHYRDPVASAQREAHHAIGTAHLAEGFEAADPSFRLAVAAAYLAELLRESPHARYVGVWQVSRVLRDLWRHRRHCEAAWELEELVRLYEVCDGGRS